VEHVTLKLVTRLMSTLPLRVIHPHLLATIGYDVCPSVELEPSMELVDQVIVLCDGLLVIDPSYYDGCAVKAVQEQLKERHLVSRHAAVLFYLALMGTDETSDACLERWSNNHHLNDPTHTVYKFVRALRNHLATKTEWDLKYIVYRFILVLIKFELQDRYEQAIQVLDAPPYIDADMQDRLLLGLFHHSAQWRKEYIRYISRRLLRCPPSELYRKFSHLPQDVASFKQCVDRVGQVSPELYQSLFDEVKWVETDPLLRSRLFLVLMTPFFRELADVLFCLTTKEKSQFTKLANPITVRRFIEDVVLPRKILFTRSQVIPYGPTRPPTTTTTVTDEPIE
jgi:hypothetical protein